MISQVTLDDHNGNPVTIHLDTNTSKWLASNATGLIGGSVSAPRPDKSVRSQAHGAINNTKYTDGASISLSCEVWGTSIEDALAQFRTISAVCLQTLDYAPALLKWTEGATGLQLQRLVKLDGAIDPPVSDGASKLAFQLQFLAEDPRAYTQAQTSVTTGVVSSLLANPGFAFDTVGSAPSIWTVKTGTFSTRQVDSSWQYGGDPNSLKLAATVAAGASAVLQSENVGVTSGQPYSVAVAVKPATLPTGLSGTTNGIVLSVEEFNSSGASLGVTVLDNLTSVISSSPDSGVAGLSGWLNLKATTTGLRVYLSFVNPATGTTGTTFQANFDAITLMRLPILTVATGGTRDTKPTIKLYGGASLKIGVGALSGSAWNWISGSLAVWLDLLHPLNIYSDGVTITYMTIDAANRTVTYDYGGGSALAGLDPFATTWETIWPGSTSVGIVGMLLGDTATVTTRDAY